MVLIMGWGSGKAKDLGPVAPAICPNCHNDVFMHEVRSNKSFSLYFVPIADYGGDAYLVCPICQHALKIGTANQQRIANMRAATASFRQGHVPEAYYRQTVDAFWGMLGVNPNGQQMMRTPTNVPPAPPPAAVPVSAAPTDQPPLAEQLRTLGELRSQGVLTDAEFSAAKKRLLEG